MKNIDEAIYQLRSEAQEVYEQMKAIRKKDEYFRVVLRDLPDRRSTVELHYFVTFLSITPEWNLSEQSFKIDLQEDIHEVDALHLARAILRQFKNSPEFEMKGIEIIEAV